MNTEKNTVKDYVVLTLGTLLVAVGIYFFKFPNNFCTGGVNGMAILLNGVFPAVSKSWIQLIINAVFLVIGYIFLGREIAVRTVYCTAMLSAATIVFEYVYPMKAPFTDNPGLELLYAMALTSLGNTMVFGKMASTGGTDILAIIFKRKLALSIGNALFASNAIIAILAGFMFSTETMLYSVLGLFINTVLIDLIVKQKRTQKCFQIITDSAEELEKFIVKDLHHSATVWEATGAYSKKKKYVVFVIINGKQERKLRRFVEENCPSSFMIRTKSDYIGGKGFQKIDDKDDIV